MYYWTVLVFLVHYGAFYIGNILPKSLAFYDSTSLSFMVVASIIDIQLINDHAVR